MKNKVFNIIKPYIPIAVILILWFIVTGAGLVNEYILPSPSKVAKSFVDMIRSGELFISLGVSLYRVLVGFAISFAIAFLASVVILFLPSIAGYFTHISNFFRAVPPIALIPLLILYFGIGELSKLVIIVLASVFPMLFDISKGFLNCDKGLIDVGRSFGFSRFKLFTKIYVPYAKKDILVGMRIGLGYSWRALIGAEMFAAASGLGYLIVDAQAMSRSDRVIIGIILIGVIGVVSDKLFSLLIKKATKEV